MICIVAAPEGVELVEQHHPDVTIYTPAIDRGLNDHKFIVPGLGDFGDRLYGTRESVWRRLMKPPSEPAPADAAGSAEGRPRREVATALTCIEPNKILMRGYPLDEIMGRLTFGETIYLLLMGECRRRGSAA